MNKKMFTDMNCQLRPSAALVAQTRERISEIPAKTPRLTMRRIGIAATALCAAAVLCVGIMQSDLFGSLNSGLSDREMSDVVEQSDEPDSNKIHSDTMPEITQAQSGKETVPAITGDEIYRVPEWNEMEIYQKYTSLEYKGNTYCIVAYFADTGEVPAAKLSAPLGTASVSGQDIYTNKTYTIDVKLFAISGISSDYAIAAKLDDSGKYYSFKIDANYLPATFGQFAADLGIKDNLVIGKIYKEDDLTRDMYIYTANNSRDIVNKLCELPDAPAKNMSFEDAGYGEDMLDLSVSIDIIGVHNLTLCITGDGYILTNLGARSGGDVFYIGKETAAELKTYVLNNSVLSETRKANAIIDEPEETVNENYSVETAVSSGVAPMF